MYTYRYPIMMWPWVCEVWRCIPMIDTLLWSDHGYVSCKDVYLWSIPYYEVTMGTWGVQMYTCDRYPIMKWSWVREEYICIPKLDILLWCDHGYVRCTDVYLWSIPYYEVTMGTWYVQLHTYDRYPIMKRPWVREVLNNFDLKNFKKGSVSPQYTISTRGSPRNCKFIDDRSRLTECLSPILV